MARLAGVHASVAQRIEQRVSTPLVGSSILSGGASPECATVTEWGSNSWEFNGSLVPMEAIVDSVGRLVSSGRTARLVEEDGRLVAESDVTITDEDVFGLLESIRR